MDELLLMVPTFYGATYGDRDRFTDKEEFDSPYVPMLVRPAEVVRVVLGSRDFEDTDKPDIRIERRPNGWAIFLHPVCGGDPCGRVYFLDDGRSFLVPDGPASGRIKVLGRGEEVPRIDDPPTVTATRSRILDSPELSAAWIQAQMALRGDSNDAEHDALLALVEALENVERGRREFNPKAAPAQRLLSRRTNPPR